MNFFAHQEQARKQSRRMIVLFTVAVIAIVLAIDAVVYFGLGLWQETENGVRASQSGYLLLSTVVVLLVIGLSTLYRISSLRGGGDTVARQLGATRITPGSHEFAYRRLRNVIEEIAIASGVPVPEIFVLEDEMAINAFAAGYTPADAAITVTRGCLDKLTREEMQGVIAHEFSHVLNGDMRLNIRLMGVAFGILVLAVVGRKIMEGAAHSRRREGGGIVILGLGLLVVGYIGVFFARIIKASISRQREYLADASAVQFTRQTEGIAGALKKIGGLAAGSKLGNHKGEEVAHMLFGDGVGYSALFATHPSLVDRIKRLQPGFNPAEFGEIAKMWMNPVQVGETDSTGASLSGFAPRVAARDRHADASSAVGLPSPDREIRLSANAVTSQVGHPGTDDYAAAALLNNSIPESLRQAAHDREQVIPLILALALDADASIRSRQLELLAAHYDPGTLANLQNMHGQIAALHPMQHLPLAALAFPALRRRPRQHLQILVAALERVIKADGRVSLAEYCLAKLVGIQVIDALDPAASRVGGRVKLNDVMGDLRDLYSIVARYGHADAASARKAYLLGMNEVNGRAIVDYSPPENWAQALDRALPRLNRLAPAGKELVVRGLVHAIGADSAVTVQEAELLRTVCAALHCPLPPLLQQAS